MSEPAATAAKKKKRRGRNPDSKGSPHLGDTGFECFMVKVGFKVDFVPAGQYYTERKKKHVDTRSSGLFRGGRFPPVSSKATVSIHYNSLFSSLMVSEPNQTDLKVTLWNLANRPYCSFGF